MDNGGGLVGIEREWTFDGKVQKRNTGSYAGEMQRSS
jgi:hypothetical protein